MSCAATASYRIEASPQRSHARRCTIAILQIIDQLADKLNNSPKLPLSSNRIVDAAEIGQLLERLRISVPSSIMESERTLQERDRILAEAENEGKRIIAQARQRATEILSADALVAMARKEYERIVEDGRTAARQRAEEADAYAAQVLEELAAKLGQLGKQVDNGLQVMRNRRQMERREMPASAPAPASSGAPDPQPRPGPHAPVAQPMPAALPPAHQAIPPAQPAPMPVPAPRSEPKG